MVSVGSESASPSWGPVADEIANSVFGSDVQQSQPVSASQESAASQESVASDGSETISKEEISLMKKALRSRLLDTTNAVKIMRNDPKSPLHSIKTFEELKLAPQLLKGLYAMGFQVPSKIQESVLPVLRE